MGGLPFDPGAVQSEMSTERMPVTSPSPTLRDVESFQNCACEIDVSAHGEST